MKLSEAIRLGAMAIPPTHGPVFVGGPEGRLCQACAIGAPLYALFGDRAREEMARCSDAAVEAVDTLFAEHWPWTAEPVEHPIWKGFVTPVVDIMINLYEGEHHWTREQIADWVEQIEAQQDQSQAEAPREPAAVEG